MATSLKIDDTLKSRVQHLAAQRRRSAHWIMLEAIQLCITVDGVGTVALPLLPQQAAELAAVAERAPYGRGPDTLVDTEVAFAAFYADCWHEVRPITAGCRLALVNIEETGSAEAVYYRRSRHHYRDSDTEEFEIGEVFERRLVLTGLHPARPLPGGPEAQAVGREGGRGESEPRRGLHPARCL